MKKLVYYAGVMTILVIMLPLLIVRGCSYQKEEIPPKKVIISVEKILIYNHMSNTVMEMSAEEYLKGVVAAEMPADFNLEALKAQAVAARTFTYGKLKGIYPSKIANHDGVPICTDHTHCQAWISKEAAMAKWGIFRAMLNWKKIEKAVLETKDIVIVYNNEIINSVYHANSGGKTENCEDVWTGKGVPYLRSVVSNGEESAKGFKVSTTFTINNFITLIKEKYPDLELSKKNILSNIKVEEYSEGGRIARIKVGNVSIGGTEFRSIFKLRSANFKIEANGKEAINIITTGYGHGVGMSQCGADYLARRGGTYEEILKYYYTGIELININDLK